MERLLIVYAVCSGCISTWLHLSLLLNPPETAWIPPLKPADTSKLLLTPVPVRPVAKRSMR